MLGQVFGQALISCSSSYPAVVMQGICLSFGQGQTPGI